MNSGRPLVNIEARIRQLIGDLSVANIILQGQVEEMAARVAELEASVPKEEKKD